MRNLRNLHFGHWTASDITSACWDPVSDEVLCTVGPTIQHPRIELFRLCLSPGDFVSHRAVARWNVPCSSPDLPPDTIVNIHYLSGLASTCIVLESGCFITVQEGQLLDDVCIEIAGSTNTGIAAAAWSPDEELLVVVTKASAVIFIARTFETLIEVTMAADDLKASKQVSVGWGKKETQFQGRGAKALRDPTIPEKVDQGLPSPHEDGSTIMSWRGDGAYVSISSVQQTNRRHVRVYARNGSLDSTSEPVDGMESSISWRPSGNVIAGVQRLTDRVDIIFFERNGLRHGQFTLRCSGKLPVFRSRIQLHWNSDSTILAVILEDIIQLWSMSNYDWQLKQEIPVHCDLVRLAWHPEKALRFVAATSDEAFMMEKIFHTCRGTCQPPYDTGAVAVIDGHNVKLTPFRTANVPPPMSLFRITVNSPIIDATFGRHNTSIAVLHRTGVDVYEMPLQKGRSLEPRFKARVSFPTDDSTKTLQPLRICCTSDSNYRCIAHLDDVGHSHFHLDVQKDCMNVLTGNEDIASTSTSEDNSLIQSYGQDGSGRLYRLSDLHSEPLPIRFPFQLPWFEVSSLEGVPVAFGLSRNGHIYANSTLLAKNCTSFTVTPNHLVFTTSNHYVKYVHLTPDVEDLQIPDDDPEQDERCRSIERGSRFVVAIPTQMSIVLQMPRGNLETIFPRAMVIAGIRDLIDHGNYSQAFYYCRTQRVDMNILYDHRPEQFLASVTSFLNQINDVAHLDLFLSSLREEDVTRTIYRDTKLKSNRIPLLNDALPKTSTDSKVNIVCDALLKNLPPQNSGNLQNIITAHVCKVPPALDDGLALVAELMEKDEDLAANAVERICFLVDVNRVYDNALGLYNLSLALLVAQQSQRDPREYLPFIQNLHTLSELRRQFEIDDHLARRSKALKNLKALDSFAELCVYVTKHELYQDALKLYRYDEPHLRILTDLYAAYLESKSAFREAGLAYETLQNYAKATSCYRAAGATCWQECLCTAQQKSPSLSADAMTELATSLADALWEAKDYKAAATIHLDHLSSLDSAIRCLCKGYNFAEAIRLSIQRGQPDLLETAVDAGLAESFSSTTEFLADCKAQIFAQVPRIAELRRMAIEEPSAFYEGERAGNTSIPDDISVAASSCLSTSASLFTRYTGKDGSLGTLGTGVSRATSKNRRREEKKRARGRKGTIYEEEYLVNSVRRLVDRVTAAGPDVERLVFTLFRRGMVERSRAAEKLMATVVDACRRSVAEVFADPLPAAEPQHPIDAKPAWRPTGGDAVLQDCMYGRSKKLERPLVASITKLSLLG